MNVIKTSAPGKIHILGEHAVVYGKPALLAAIDKRCNVAIEKKNDAVITIHSTQLSDVKQFTVAQVLGISPTLTKSNLYDHVAYTIGESMRHFKKTKTSGLTLSVNSDIALGCGMGSSAAVAVAVAGAMCVALDVPFDKKTINAIAYKAEKRQHKNPSGADNTTSCFGGIRWYQRPAIDMPVQVLETQQFPKSFLDNLSVFYTGRPHETTAEMILLVKEFAQKNPEKFQSFLQKQELLSNRLQHENAKNNMLFMTEIIKDAQKNLETIGVVSKECKALISAIEKVDGAAKISGAGGKKKNSGVVLALGNRKKLLKIAKFYGLKSEPVFLSTEGVRVD